MFYQFLAWLLVGALAGWLASAVTGERRGCLGNTVLGILGGVVSGFLFYLAVNTRLFGISLAEVLMSALGACLVLLLWRRPGGSRFPG